MPQLATVCRACHLLFSCRDALLEASTSDVDASPGTSTGSSHVGAGSGGLNVRWQRGVDLGCGTGLMGLLLRPLVGYLEGVDLSSGMVDKAHGKGCYDRQVQIDRMALTC